MMAICQYSDAEGYSSLLTLASRGLVISKLPIFLFCFKIKKYSLFENPFSIQGNPMERKRSHHL
jgi:hypothetical protein